MAEKIAQGVEGVGVGAVVTIWISSVMDWLNENHFAVVSIVAIITGIVTIVAAWYRIRFRQREIDIYEKEVNKHRRKTDK